jgi:hypothetical protein
VFHALEPTTGCRESRECRSTLTVATELRQASPDLNPRGQISNLSPSKQTSDAIQSRSVHGWKILTRHPRESAPDVSRVDVSGSHNIQVIKSDSAFRNPETSDSRFRGDDDNILNGKQDSEPSGNRNKLSRSCRGTDADSRGWNTFLLVKKVFHPPCRPTSNCITDCRGICIYSDRNYRDLRPLGPTQSGMTSISPSA